VTSEGAAGKEILTTAWAERSETLDEKEAAAIAATGLVEVKLDDPRMNSWTLVSGSKVGVMIGDSWTLRVQPKLTVSRLMFLLGYAADPRGWRNFSVPFGEEEDIFAAVANGFAAHALRAVEPSPLRGYRSVDERAPALRGRLRAGDQIARGKGLPIPLEITYDDFTVDIAENRFIRAATEFLLRLRRLPTPTRNRLRRVRALLAEVEPWVSPNQVEPPITRLNQRYGPALRLAGLIVRHRSISTDAGQVQSVGFIFNMDKVFEDFVFTALREALAPFGGSVRGQHKGRFLDQERSLGLIPDISWWKGHTCQAVVDAKYKRVRDKRFPNGDAYQMLAYCTAFDLPTGVLAYAQSEDTLSGNHTVVQASKRLLVRALDVGQEPDRLLRSVDVLAEELRANVATAEDAPELAATAG